MTKRKDPAAVAGVGIGAVPKQARGIEVRDRLLEAAVEEFTEMGVDDSRVERIVERAGTSWGTFFRYFPRKEDVYLVETARQFRDHVIPIYDRALEDDSIPIESTLRELFDQMVHPRRSPGFHAEMINEAVQHPARLAAIIGEGEIPLAALVANLLRLGQERGEVRADVPAPLCAMVVTAGMMFSSSYALRGLADGNLGKEEVARINRQAFDLGWSGLRPVTGPPPASAGPNASR